VAAPHFGTTGDVFRGSYDLVMRSDVARCVYGFTKAPINATLSITSNDGVPQVATVVVGERNGWLYLQAKNFEFSSPVITAKLTQKKNQKYSINCVKGSKTKKVTGTSPKCPSGYKKAA
jgi:choline kinase